MKVLVTGTFDVLHKGHLNFFRQAREYGDELVVVVARDATVKKIKGKAPFYSEEERLKAVKDSGFADKVVLGNLDDKYRVLEEEQPDVVCLGYDQSAFTGSLESELSERGVDARIVRLEAYKPEIYKSSKLKENIKK